MTVSTVERNWERSRTKRRAKHGLEPVLSLLSLDYPVIV